LLIAFSTQELRDLCTDDTHAIEQLGKNASDALKNRLKDIDAADSINEVLAGRPRRVMFEGQACYVIELADEVGLTIGCSQVNPKRDAQGNVDWSRVRRVKVVFVGRA
jgi:proteic killer suppression protein